MLIARNSRKLSTVSMLCLLLLGVWTPCLAANKPTFPVLVEFFDTTTPAAQKLLPEVLAEAQKNPDVILLDYRLGLCSDPGANVISTQRRSGYAGLFGIGFIREPGIVVDGVKKATPATLAAEVAAQRGKEKVPVTLSAQSTYNKLDIKATYFDNLHRTYRARVNFVIVEDDPSDKIAGTAGNLRRVGVVRKIIDRGFVISDQAANFSVSLPLEAGWKKKDLRVVLFVQDPVNKRVPLVAACPVKVQE